MSLTRQDCNKYATQRYGLRLRQRCQNSKYKISARGCTRRKVWKSAWKMIINITYFILFCNLVNILHVTVGPAATKVKKQKNPGFPAAGKSHSTDGALKLLPCTLTVPDFLFGMWHYVEHWKGSLFGNEEYEGCRLENSQWLLDQITEPSATTTTAGQQTWIRACQPR